MSKRNRRQNRRAGSPKRRLGVQPLEARKLMAADIGWNDGFITILGTADQDVVETWEMEGQIVVRAQQFDQDGHLVGSNESAFAVDQVKGVYFEGRHGDDVLIAEAPVPTVGIGGPGNDLLIGSLGPNLLAGGVANDLLIGRLGDLLLPGPGDNTVVVTVEGNPGPENQGPSPEELPVPEGSPEGNEPGGQMDDALEASAPAAQDLEMEPGSEVADSTGPSGSETLADQDASGEDDSPAGPATDPTATEQSPPDAPVEQQAASTESSGEPNELLCEPASTEDENNSQDGNATTSPALMASATAVETQQSVEQSLSAGEAAPAGEDSQASEQPVDETPAAGSGDQSVESDNDVLIGGTGNDILIGDQGDDWLWGGYPEMLVSQLINSLLEDLP